MYGSTERPAATPPARRLQHRAHSASASVPADSQHRDGAVPPPQNGCRSRLSCWVDTVHQSWRVPRTCGVHLQAWDKGSEKPPDRGTAPAIDVVAAMSLAMRTVWSEDELATTHSSRTELVRRPYGRR